MSSGLPRGFHWRAHRGSLFPHSVMIMTSDSSATCSAATTGPLRSVDFRLMTPLPPREVMRYSASGVQSLPKLFFGNGQH